MMDASAQERMPDSGYEPRDASPRDVTLGLAGLFAVLIVSAALVGGLFAILESDDGGPAIEAPRGAPPPPRLQVDPAADRAVLEAAARALLTGYGWTDRAAGRARIPIERAIEILAARGWPQPPSTGAAPP